MRRWVFAFAALLAFRDASAGTPDDMIYARPGEIAAATDGARLNFYCMGSGTPAVIIDSGFEDWSPDWAPVQPHVAKFTRVCSYDRAGEGFSGPGPLPRTSVRIAQELRDALHQAGVAGPYILLGHAFGGDNVRAFADLYPDEVAGLVLVDADTGDVESAAMQAKDHRFDAEVLAELRACRDAVAKHRPLPLLKTPPGQPPQTCAQQFFRGLPEARWSAGLNAELLKLAETKVALYDAVISEWEQMRWDEVWLQQHRRTLGSRPVRVLTTGNHGVHFLKDGEHKSAKLLKYEDEIKAAQARWLALSSDARQVFTHHSSEYVNFDEPDTLVSVIREVYDKSR